MVAYLGFYSLAILALSSVSILFSGLLDLKLGNSPGITSIYSPRINSGLTRSFSIITVLIQPPLEPSLDTAWATAFLTKLKAASRDKSGLYNFYIKPYTYTEPDPPRAYCTGLIAPLIGISKTFERKKKKKNY